MTSPDIRSLLLDALRTVPELATSSQLDASPLREGINRTFLVTVDGWQRFAVRLCEPGMAELVARDAEQDCARRMAHLGVSVELLSLDTASGTLVTRWERGARAIEATAFSDGALLRRAIRLLRKAHSLKPPLRATFDAADRLACYLDICERRGQPIPAELTAARARLLPTMDALRRSAPASVPCHNDPAPSNFIELPNGLRLLDWEFGGMNDPLWDLVSLALGADLSPSAEPMLLGAYFGDEAPPAADSRMALYEPLYELTWGAFKLARLAVGAALPEALERARANGARALSLLERPESREHLGAVLATLDSKASQPPG